MVWRELFSVHVWPVKFLHIFVCSFDSINFNLNSQSFEFIGQSTHSHRHRSVLVNTYIKSEDAIIIRKISPSFRTFSVIFVLTS